MSTILKFKYYGTPCNVKKIQTGDLLKLLTKRVPFFCTIPALWLEPRLYAQSHSFWRDQFVILQIINHSLDHIINDVLFWVLGPCFWLHRPNEFFCFYIVQIRFHSDGFACAWITRIMCITVAAMIKTVKAVQFFSYGLLFLL